MKLKVFYQATQFDCGLKALQSMLYYYSDGKNIIENEDLNHKEYNLKELKDISENYLMDVEGVEISQESLLNEKGILILLKINNIQHYVFFIKMIKNYAFIIDPKYGKRLIKKEKFLSMFTGFALEMKSIQKMTNKPSLNVKDFLIDIIIEIFFSIPFFVFILIIIFDSYLSLYLVLLIAASLIIKRQILLYRMKKFDNYIESKINDAPNIVEDDINSLYKYKKAKFTYIPSIYNSLIYHFSFLLFLGILKNGIYLALIYGIYIIYIFIEPYIFKEKIIELDSIDDKDKYNKYHQINISSNKIINLKENIKLIITIAFIVLIYIFNYLFFKSNETMYVLMILCIYLINKDDISNILSIEREYEVGKTIYNNLK